MNFLKYLLIFSIGLGISACGMYEPVDQRGRPDTAKERARKNIEEGRGVSIGSVLNRTGKTIMNLQIPFGGVMKYEIFYQWQLWTTLEAIITDWYSDASSSNQIL